MTAAQTTVPVMTPSLPLTSRRGPDRRSSSATEGLQEDGPLGIGEVGADQPAVTAVEPLAEAVQVGALGHQEQGRAAGANLGSDPLQVLLRDPRAGGGLDEGADPGAEREAGDRDREEGTAEEAPQCPERSTS